MTKSRKKGWLAGTALLLCAGTAAAVTVPGDYGTIQAALDAVSAGSLPSGTIVEVQPGTYMEAVRYASTSRSITLRSVAGAGSTIINSAGTGLPALTVQDASGTVAVDGFTMTGASSASGGGVYFNNASPTLSNCVIQGNHTPNGGGGVLLFTSNAVIDNCTIMNNTAGTVGGGLAVVDGSRPWISNSIIQNNVSGILSSVGSGGGILANDSSMTILNTEIKGNQSRFAGGGILVIGVYGSPNGTATLTLEDSEVSDNTTARFDASSPSAAGGGIHIEDNTLARIIRSRIKDNTANQGGGLSSFRSRYEVTDSVIEGNHAQDSQAIPGTGGGGGVQALAGRPQASVVTLTNSVVRNNDAVRGGGVLVIGDGCGAGGVCSTLTLTRAVIDSNVANAEGGGVNAAGAVMNVTDSQVLRNRVTAAAGAFGGGFQITTSTATITTTTIAGNSAVRGGGLYADVGADVTVRQSNIYDNTATETNGGGGVFVGQTGPPTGSIENSQIADNSDFQIREEAGPPPGVPAPILSYLSNAIANEGLEKVYMSPVFPPGQITSIRAFNNLSPGVRTVGNTSTAPNFTSFAATPPQAPTTLTWSVARATTVNIDNLDPASQPGPTNSKDVSPPCTTVYTLNGVNATVIGPPPTCSDTSAPTITSDGGGPTAVVNAAENQTAVTDVQSTDPEGETEGNGLTYRLSGGVDQTKFSIDWNSGLLRFNSPPDFEKPGDANSLNDYEVQVTVTDSTGRADLQSITVMVTDVIEGGGCAFQNTLDLTGATVTITETRTACVRISAGPAFAVNSPGDLTFRAGNVIILNNGFSVGGGAKFTAWIDNSL